MCWVSGWKTILQEVDNDCDATEASEYPKVFQLPYVKSSVCDYKKKFKEFPQELINQFVQYGNICCGSWQQFSHAKSCQDQAAKQTHLAVVHSSTSDNPLTLTHSSTHLPQHIKDSRQIKCEESSPVPDTQDSANLPEPAPEASTSSHVPQQLCLPLPIEEDTPEDIALDAALAKHQPLFEHVMAAIADDKTHKDSEIDHTKLCPFCDNIMPNSPSASLIELSTHLKGLSQPDPTPKNPLHCKCPGGFAQHIDFCLQHHDERKDMPVVLQEGWPLEPDFLTLYDCVCCNYLFIAEISESTNNGFLQSAKDYYSVSWYA